MRWERAVIAAIILIAAAGCGTPSQKKSPEELLSLSVSGLAGIDRYAFSGMTGIAVEDGTLIKPMPFNGTVENHNRINIKSSGDTTIKFSLHPLELLKQVEASAGTTELVAAESGNRTAVLRVQADKAKAAKLWKENLRSEFEAVKRQSVAASASGQNASKGIMRSKTSDAAYAKERDAELARSGRELDRMLSTLQVDSTYRIVIDRSRLVPLKMEEATVLKYTTAGGDKRREQRKMSIDFKPLPQ